jgi:hypothetical protein
MRRRTVRKLLVLGAILGLLGAATACDPIVNAPPGGGAVTTTAYRIGPFNLAPMGQAGSENQSTQTNIPKPPTPFGMKSITFDLVRADGTPVPHSAAHLHHVVLMNPARRSMNCTSQWPERFAGSGSERTPISFPDPYAYMTNSGEQWNALWHVMNESDQPQQVYIQYTVGYQPGANTSNTRGVTPFFLDVTGCGGSTYQVPGNGGPGSVHTNTRTWNAPWTGYLVNAGGHLHGGGIDITLRNNTQNIACTMTAKYEHSHPEGAPGSITTCPTHRHVNAGDSYSVISRYDNSQPYTDVMGIVMAYAWQGTQ